MNFDLKSIVSFIKETLADYGKNIETKSAESKIRDTEIGEAMITNTEQIGDEFVSSKQNSESPPPERRRP